MEEKFFDTDTKMNMTLEDIIHAGGSGPKKWQRQTAKQQATNNNKRTAAQRKQQQAKAASNKARTQRQKSFSNKRGMVETPQTQQQQQQQRGQPRKRGFSVRPSRGASGGNVSFRNRTRGANANQGQTHDVYSQGPVTRQQANSQRGRRGGMRNLKVNVFNDPGESPKPRRLGLKQSFQRGRGARGARGGYRGNSRTNDAGRSANVVISRQQNQRRQTNAVNKARGITSNRVVLQENGGGNQRESTLNDRFSNAPHNQPRRGSARGRGRGRGGRGKQQFNAPSGRGSRRVVSG